MTSGPVAVEVADHTLTLFVETAPLLAEMLRDIATAQSRVWLETYIFLDDAVGSAMAEALKERAAAGVEVRVLYDAVGSQWTPAAFFRELREAGAEVHVFHSVWEALWRFSFLRVLNRRDHRKLLVIDDRVAYFGGMNVADAGHALGFDSSEKLPESVGWRDVHVRLVGPQQAEVAESFDRSWRMAHGERVPRRPRAYRRGRLAQAGESIQFFDSGPGRRHTRAARLFTHLVRAARRSITLSMAYFLPVGPVLRALLRAPKRDVRVRVVVPGDSDVRLVQHATHYLYDRLLRRRIRIYERQHHMLHSKVMVVDDEWSIVGSCNLDARSLYINHEFLAVIHSPSLAKALNEIVEGEIACSTRISIKAYRGRSCWRRLIGRLAWMLRWWL
jgi:cardiolipin synthase